MRSMEMILKKIDDFLLQIPGVKGGKILTAFSGGKDSAVLLDILSSRKEKFGFSLGVAYVNHNLRGEESAAEEEFVRLRVESYGLDLFIERVEPGYFSNGKGDSVESKARTVRYSFFNRIMDSHGYQYTTTAHTFTDKIETFFINILRGGATDSLVSIPSSNNRILRPLLNVNRSDIKSYCECRELSWFEDSSNALGIYKRNRIRHEILPSLEKMTGNLDSAMQAVFRSLEEDTDFINEYSMKKLSELIISHGELYYNLRIDGFRALHQAVRSRIIKYLIIKFGGGKSLNSGLIAEISSGKRVNTQCGSCGIYTKSKSIWFYNADSDFNKSLNM